MNREEYQDFLRILFERYVRPNRWQIWRYRRHHIEDEWIYHFERARRAVRLLRFIEHDRNDGSDIYDTFTVERIARTIADIHYSLKFANRVMDEAGFLTVFDLHGSEIAADMQPEDLPKEDAEILRDFGGSDPIIELSALVYLARAELGREAGRREQIQIEGRLEDIEKRLENTEAAFRKDEEGTSVAKSKAPRKSRKWFKGLGQIGQGAALSIANVGIAFGGLHLPVSPETQTWGAIVSVVTGIGTILNGAGDLRGE